MASLLALLGLHAAPATAQTSGGEVIDLDCELTIHRNRTRVTIWPLVKDVPAGGVLVVKMNRVGGGGMVEDQRAAQGLARSTRRAFGNYEGEWHACRAEASWTYPAAGASGVQPLRGRVLDRRVTLPPRVMPKRAPAPLPR